MSKWVYGSNQGSDDMTAAFATLVFLATMWLLIVVATMVMEKKGAQIRAALKGRSMEPAVSTPSFRLRHRERDRTAYRATPRLRAAA